MALLDDVAEAQRQLTLVTQVLNDAEYRLAEALRRFPELVAQRTQERDTAKAAREIALQRLQQLQAEAIARHEEMAVWDAVRAGSDAGRQDFNPDIAVREQRRDEVLALVTASPAVPFYRRPLFKWLAAGAILFVVFTRK